jgi:hypothetical protein
LVIRVTERLAWRVRRVTGLQLDWISSARCQAQVRVRERIVVVGVDATESPLLSANSARGGAFFPRVEKVVISRTCLFVAYLGVRWLSLSEIITVEVGHRLLEISLAENLASLNATAAGDAALGPVRGGVAVRDTSARVASLGFRLQRVLASTEGVAHWKGGPSLNTDHTNGAGAIATSDGAKSRARVVDVVVTRAVLNLA